MAINVPAATAVPITPATFCETLAAIGTADTPAEPISGLTLPCVTRHIILPNNTPAAVPNANAISPNATIFNVSRLRNASALVVAPTDVPRIITTMYIRSCLCQLLNNSTFLEKVT